MSLLSMPSRTFTAKLFEITWEGKQFSIAGSLDGFIDLAVPGGGTYPLSLEEATQLRDALDAAINDVKANCMYERDSLLIKDGL